MSELDAEWLEALEVEEEVTTPPVTDDDKGDDDVEDTTPDDDKGAEDATDKPDTPKGDEDSPTDDTEGAKPVPEDDEAPDTKAIVKEAIQELETSKASRVEAVSGLKGEVAKTLYPQGISRQLLDSDGDPINGIEDVTQLINPKTGDYFTEEQAGRWLLASQKKLNEDVEIVENFVEGVAETLQNLNEGAERVAEKYKDILSKDEGLKNRLLEQFNKTLIKDPATGVTIKAPLDVEEFFDLALEPIISQRDTQVEAEKKAKLEADKLAQGERGDLKPSGKSDNLDPEDKEWAQANKDYLEGV